MRYGNCISYKNTKHIKILKDAGFDYIETLLAPIYSAPESDVAE